MAIDNESTGPTPKVPVTFNARMDELAEIDQAADRTGKPRATFVRESALAAAAVVNSAAA